MIFQARSRLVRFLGSLKVPANLLPPLVGLLMSFGKSFMGLEIRLRRGTGGYGCGSE